MASAAKQQRQQHPQQALTTICLSLHSLTSSFNCCVVLPLHSRDHISCERSSRLVGLSVMAGIPRSEAGCSAKAESACRPVKQWLPTCLEGCH
jgi:hypothetical protein